MKNPGILTITAQTLRNPRSLLDADDSSEQFAHLAPRLLAIAASGAVLFGMVVGSYRGGIQLLYAGVKMPLLLLLPVLVGLPAIHGLLVASELEIRWSRLALAALIGLARGAVLAAAASPVLWLMFSMPLDYHLTVLILAGALMALMIPGLSVLVQAIPGKGPRRLLASVVAIGVIGVVTMQTGWLLRPFVARPTVEVAFLRPVEEDVFSSLAATASAAAGVYQNWEAEPAGAVGEWQELQRTRRAR